MSSRAYRPYRDNYDETNCRDERQNTNFEPSATAKDWPMPQRIFTLPCATEGNTFGQRVSPQRATDQPSLCSIEMSLSDENCNPLSGLARERMTEKIKGVRKYQSSPPYVSHNDTESKRDSNQTGRIYQSASPSNNNSLPPVVVIPLRYHLHTPKPNCSAENTSGTTSALRSCLRKDSNSSRYHDCAALVGSTCLKSNSPKYSHDTIGTVGPLRSCLRNYPNTSSKFCDESHRDINRLLKKPPTKSLLCESPLRNSTRLSSPPRAQELLRPSMLSSSINGLRSQLTACLQSSPLLKSPRLSNPETRSAVPYSPISRNPATLSPSLHCQSPSYTLFNRPLTSTPPRSNNDNQDDNPKRNKNLLDDGEPFNPSFVDDSQADNPPYDKKILYGGEAFNPSFNNDNEVDNPQYGKNIDDGEPFNPCFYNINQADPRCSERILDAGEPTGDKSPYLDTSPPDDKAKVSKSMLDNLRTQYEKQILTLQEELESERERKMDKAECHVEYDQITKNLRKALDKEQQQDFDCVISQLKRAHKHELEQLETTLKKLSSVRFPDWATLPLRTKYFIFTQKWINNLYNKVHDKSLELLALKTSMGAIYEVKSKMDKEVSEKGLSQCMENHQFELTNRNRSQAEVGRYLGHKQDDCENSLQDRLWSALRPYIRSVSIQWQDNFLPICSAIVLLVAILFYYLVLPASVSDTTPVSVSPKKSCNSWLPCEPDD